MELIAIRTDDPRYAEAEALMAAAFPPEERRPEAQQRQFTDHEPAFRPHIVTLDGAFAGLLNYWALDGFVYAEHLATLPSLRGGGLGRRVMEQLAAQAGCPIVLEVEPPTDDLKRRRIGFYQRCGFKLWEKRPYTQPPYSDGQPALALHLMVLGDLDEERDFGRVCREIHTRVYGCSPETSDKLTQTK